MRCEAGRVRPPTRGLPPRTALANARRGCHRAAGTRRQPLNTSTPPGHVHNAPALRRSGPDAPSRRNPSSSGTEKPREDGPGAVRRRRGDSNPRGASTPTSLAGRRTRPLCDVSRREARCETTPGRPDPAKRAWTPGSRSRRGGRGIRTPGARGAQRFSRPPHSAALSFLHGPAPPPGRTDLTASRPAGCQSGTGHSAADSVLTAPLPRLASPAAEESATAGPPLPFPGRGGRGGLIETALGDGLSHRGPHR